MLTADQWEAMHRLFQPESLSFDTSQELELIRLKAAYFIKRLNEVFEPCGTGWPYAQAPAWRSISRMMVRRSPLKSPSNTVETL
jgi:hypothetical protein